MWRKNTLTQESEENNIRFQTQLVLFGVGDSTVDTFPFLVVFTALHKSLSETMVGQAGQILLQ
jgi:hypothetical protein